jgi:hypothetical protein
MQFSIDNLPHNIILPLHRIVARGVSPVAPAWHDSYSESNFLYKGKISVICFRHSPSSGVLREFPEAVPVFP